MYFLEWVVGDQVYYLIYIDLLSLILTSRLFNLSL